MKVKVTDKVKGEMVVACLGGSLRKNDVLTLDAYKSSHQDVLWAIHHGYLEVMEEASETNILGDMACFVNCGKRTLTGKMFAKPLDPSRSIVVHKNDPVFGELMKLVNSGRLCISQPSIKTSDSLPKEEKKSESPQELSKSNSHKNNEAKKPNIRSFKKNTKKKTEEPNNTVDEDILKPVQDKLNLNAKTTKGITTVEKSDPIFVDMNGEVS